MYFELTTLFLIISLSLDSLFAAYSYGTNKIKVYIWNMVIFSFIASIIYICSILFSSLILNWFNIDNLKLIGGIILIFMGLSKLIDPLIKRSIKNHPSKRNIGFKTNSFKIIINIYAEPLEADYNDSKTLSLKETILLSLAMNVDSLLSGLMIDSYKNSWYLVGLISFLLNFVFLFLGYFIGQKIGNREDKDFSFIGGFLLIILGIKVLF